MGWSFQENQTKKELVNQIILNYETQNSIVECLDYSLQGNELWVLSRVSNFCNDETENFITLYLLSKSKNYGYGYKALPESAHPYYYKCPLKFLKRAPERNKEWRNAVIEYNKKKNKKISFVVGDTIQLSGSSENETIELTQQLNKNCFIGYTTQTKKRYKITKKWLNDATLVE